MAAKETSVHINLQEMYEVVKNHCKRKDVAVTAYIRQLIRKDLKLT